MRCTLASADQDPGRDFIDRAIRYPLGNSDATHKREGKGGKVVGSCYRCIERYWLQPRKVFADSEPYDVATQGFKALVAGHEHVYAASLITKVQGTLMGLIPDSVQAALHNSRQSPWMSRAATCAMKYLST